VSGVLMRSMDCIVWDYGKILGGAPRARAGGGGGVTTHARFVVGDGSNIRF
jgi:hypothetical protein